MGAVSIAMAERRPGNTRQTELTMQHVWGKCTPVYSVWNFVWNLIQFGFNSKLEKDKRRRGRMN
jgi:hypothetical protein